MICSGVAKLRMLSRELKSCNEYAAECTTISTQAVDEFQCKVSIVHWLWDPVLHVRVGLYICLHMHNMSEWLTVLRPHFEFTS